MRGEKSLKERIVDVAWELFYEKGYDNTTVDEIIQKCGVSKGGFYHYFRAKDDLLDSLADKLDAQYENCVRNMKKEANSYEKLIRLSEFLFRYIEDKIPVDILSLVLSTQVIKRGEKYLLDHNRYYFKVLNVLVKEGQERGQIITSKPPSELVKYFALQERAILYDWCICGGNYPLSSYGIKLLRFAVQNIAEKQTTQG